MTELDLSKALREVEKKIDSIAENLHGLANLLPTGPMETEAHQIAHWLRVAATKMQALSEEQYLYDRIGPLTQEVDSSETQ